MLAAVALALALAGPWSPQSLATEAVHQDDPAIIEQVSEQAGPIIDLKESLDHDLVETEPLSLLEQTVDPGEFVTLDWRVNVSGLRFAIPVLVAHGSRVGPTVCLSAAVHGDELNGIEIARRVIFALDPSALAGTVVAVPIVNMEGFLKQSRYIADRRDLNRYFPGNPRGITPERYAYQFFQQIVRHCEALIDLHTGSYFRTNLPQLRADLTDERVNQMVSYFGNMTVLQSAGQPGMLRNAAVRAEIPAVTMEVGGPLALQLDEVEFGVKAIRTFLSEVGMIKSFSFLRKPQPVFYESEWLIADHNGILITQVKLGEQVKQGDKLAVIINPVNNFEHDVTAPFDGTVLGMGENQFVSEGFMILRLGKQTTAQEIIAETESAATSPKPAPAREEVPPPSEALGETVLPAPEEDADGD